MATDRATDLREKTDRGNSLLDELIDLEFEAFCARDKEDAVTLDESRMATASIPWNLSDAIIEHERADQF